MNRCYLFWKKPWREYGRWGAKELERVAEREASANVSGSKGADLPSSISDLRAGGARIIFHGYLGRDELTELLCRCDVGLIPMYPESMVAVPYKLGDYAGNGLAVVHSLSGELDVLIKKYKAGVYYSDRDTDALATVLQAYMDHPELIELHRKGSRQLAETELDRNKIYPAFARWIREEV